jgi:Domain of Unknown Function (DUF1080)
MRAIPLILLGCIATAAAEDNKLTREEKKDGWKLLFDGKSLKGWIDPAKENVPGNAWALENGTVKTVRSPRVREDLLTQEVFTDFELAFDWKVQPGGNTGVKYRIQDTIFIDETKHTAKKFEEIVGAEYAKHPSDRKALKAGAPNQVYVVGYEMQLIDNERHPDAKRDKRHTTGALYSMIAPARTDAAKPAGEWNSSRIKVQGQHFEHWINGIKVLDGELDSPPVAEGASKRWGLPAPPVREMLSHPKPAGRLGLQHHEDEAWFKNVKVKKLTAGGR